MSTAEILSELWENSLRIESLQGKLENRLLKVENSSAELSKELKSWQVRLGRVQESMRESETKQLQQEETIKQLQESQAETKSSFESYVEETERDQEKKINWLKFGNSVLIVLDILFGAGMLLMYVF